MPLPVPEIQKLIIDEFQGIDVERGRLERPVGSFRLLRNFDLVKPGVIKKILGSIKRQQISTHPIVGMRDYQQVATGPILLVAVDSFGGLFFTTTINAPWSSAGALFSPPAVMETAPFLVSLPLDDAALGKKQYIVVTIGSKGVPKKWDGTIGGITDLGIPNPGDSFTEQYQHSVAIPQLHYTNGVTSQTQLLYSTNDPTQGIPIVTGRKYRASWYNPTTKHDSSLFPLSLAPYALDQTPISTPQSPTKALGTLITESGAQFVMAVPLFLDNLPQRNTILQVTAPQSGYTKLRIWATRDGGSDYFLVPRLYDINGKTVTDENGAVDYAAVGSADGAATGLYYGFSGPLEQIALKTSPLFDGFVPLVNAGNSAPLWYRPMAWNELTDYVVQGGGQAIGSTTLNTTFTAATNTTKLYRGLFQIEGDATIYRIVSNPTGGPANYTFPIDPPLKHSPANGARLNFLFALPVMDIELTTPFATQEEVGAGLNTDHLNDPPPNASWGVVYSNRLFLLNSNDPTELRYSRIGQYESFPPDNVFRFVQSDFDPITALLNGRQVGYVSQGADAQLIVAKQRTSAKITGTSLADFAIQSMFSETGIVHKRAAVVVGGFFVGLSRQGLELFEGQQPFFVGSKIRDIVNQIKIEDNFGPCFVTRRKDDLLLLGVNLQNTPVDLTEPQIDTVFLMRRPVVGDNGFSSPFSEMAQLPTRLGVLLETNFGGDVFMVAAGVDGYLYQLFSGGKNGGDDSVIVAAAETQELPHDDKESRKIFRRLRFDGNDVTADTGWKVKFSVDGGNFTALRKMYTETLIGLVGRQIVIHIEHDREISNDETPPQLSNMMLEYIPIGTSRVG